MANANSRGIKQSWSLLAFVKEHKQPGWNGEMKAKDGSTFAAMSFSSDTFDEDQVRSFIDKEGKQRKSAFVTVSFSSEIPVEQHTEQFIYDNVDKLRVVELEKDGEHSDAAFKLCIGNPLSLGKTMHIA